MKNKIEYKSSVANNNDVITHPIDATNIAENESHLYQKFTQSAVIPVFSHKYLQKTPQIPQNSGDLHSNNDLSHPCGVSPVVITLLGQHFYFTNSSSLFLKYIYFTDIPYFPYKFPFQLSYFSQNNA